jgi:hypothetical protein
MADSSETSDDAKEDEDIDVAETRMACCAEPTGTPRCVRRRCQYARSRRRSRKDSPAMWTKSTVPSSLRAGGTTDGSGGGVGGGGLTTTKIQKEK